MAASRERLNELLALEAQEQESSREKLERLKAIEESEFTSLAAKEVPEGNIMDSIIEPVKTIMGDVAGLSIGGIGGMAATPFVGSEGASDVIQDIQQDFSSPPQTKSGQKSLEAIQNLVQQGIDVARVPQSLIGGLIDMSIQGEPIEAIKTAIDIHQDGVVPLAQEATFEATDSPLAATAVGVIPELAGSLFPFAFGKNIKTGGLTRADATRLDRKRRGIKDSKFTNTNLFESTVEIDRQRALQIKQKSPDKELAKFTIDRDGNLIDDDLAAEVIKQGIDPGVVQSIKNMSRLDKITSRKMLRNLKKGMADADFRITNRPSDFIGESLKKKLIFLKKKNTESGQELNQVAESLKGIPVDLATPVNNFSAKLEEFGIGVINDGKSGFKPDFTDTSLAPGDRGPIKEVIRQMNRLGRSGNPDAFTAHKMKQIIDRNVEFGRKSKSGISGEAERALKSFRHDRS